MKKSTKNQFIKFNLLTALFLGLFSMANARSYTFNTIPSDCPEVSNMTTTLTITGIKVTGVHMHDYGFNYAIVFSMKNEFTGTATGDFNTYNVAFQSTRSDVSSNSASFSPGTIPMSSTTTNDLEVTSNSFNGFDMQFIGLSNGVIYSDPTFIKKLGYATATITMESQCFDAVNYTAFGVTLPVKLARFQASKGGNQALLSWTTLSEQHNKGFEIQRSIDSKEWVTVGFAESKAEDGNSSEAIHYTFTDMAPLQAVNFYRLKQIDLDQRFEYSEIRKVSFGRNSSIVIYPNPAQTVINISGLEATDVLKLSSITGQHIKTIQAGKEAIILNMNELANGIYFISVNKANGAVESFQFVKENR